MSKNRNYQNYYSKPVADEPTNEPIEQKTEDVKEIEVASETVADAVSEETKETETPAITKKAIVINANLVNMRENPVKDAAIICQVKKGTVVEIGSTTILGSDWSHIKVNNKTGFMMSQFLKEI